MVYEVVSSTVAYDGRLTRLRVDEVTMPGGDTATREVAEHFDAVAVVALDASGHVILLRQYRHPVGRYLLELPAGMLDVDGEEPAEAARRELAEEVGLEAAGLAELVRFENSAGWSDETTVVYLATGLAPVDQPDGFTAEHEEADMEVVRLPLADAVAMAEAGDVTDAKTLIGLLLVRDRAGAH